jgi:hypothetical protein
VPTLRSVLKSVCELWTRQIEFCRKRKQREFGDAKEEIDYYRGKRYSRRGIIPMTDGAPQVAMNWPEYETYYNMSQCFSDVMTPYVLARVPNRMYTPRLPPLPAELVSFANEIAQQQQMQAEQMAAQGLPPPPPSGWAAAVPQILQAQKEATARDTMTCYLLKWLGNWWPEITGLIHECKEVVQESFSGMGVAWTEMADGPFGPIPATYADSINNLLIDPDCKQLREASYICRIRRLSLYKIADIYGEDIDLLRGQASSNLQLAMRQNDSIDMGSDEPNDSDPEKKDIGIFFEFWSRIGIGEKLVLAPDELKQLGPIRDALDAVGPYVHFSVMPGMEWPLGMNPDVLEGRGNLKTTGSSGTDPSAGGGAPADGDGPDKEPDNDEDDQEIQSLVAVFKDKLEWPIKVYEYTEEPWPCSALVYKPNIDNPWARSPLESGLPLQRFIDRTFTTFFNRVHTAGRDMILTSSELEQSVREALQSGRDQEIIHCLEQVSKENVDKLIHFIKFPELNHDLFEILNLAVDAWQKLTGLDPSMYGGVPHTQERSAAASAIKGSGLARRPDDYADAVENWLSVIAQKELIATRLLVDVQTVVPVFREKIQSDGQNTVYGPLTQAWVSLVKTDDPAIAAAEVDCTVQAGSGRRKNLQLAQANAQQIWTMCQAPFYALYEATGNAEPFTMLLRYIFETMEAVGTEPLVEAFEKVIQEAQQMAQQMGVQGAHPAMLGKGPGNQPGQPSPEGGESPGQEAKSNPTASRVAGRWGLAAGGPPNKVALPSAPPETSGP